MPANLWRLPGHHATGCDAGSSAAPDGCCACQPDADLLLASLARPCGGDHQQRPRCRKPEQGQASCCAPPQPAAGGEELAPANGDAQPAWLLHQLQQQLHAAQAANQLLRAQLAVLHCNGSSGAAGAPAAAAPQDEPSEQGLPQPRRPGACVEVDQLRMALQHKQQVIQSMGSELLKVSRALEVRGDRGNAERLRRLELCPLDLLAPGGAPLPPPALHGANNNNWARRGLRTRLRNLPRRLPCQLAAAAPVLTGCPPRRHARRRSHL
jgi:hypothetical protein